MPNSFTCLSTPDQDLLAVCLLDANLPMARGSPWCELMQLLAAHKGEEEPRL